MSKQHIERRVFLAGFPALLLGRAQAAKAGGIESLYEPDTFARIAPGTFRMGFAHGLEDEGPEHEVRITKPFDIAKLEVTQAQWEAVMRDPHQRSGQQRAPNPAEDPISATPSHFKGSDLPVESVSWDDVQVFLTRLNTRDVAFRFRLPTEAEWEFACRGSSKPAALLKEASGEAWFQANADATTHSVGTKKASGAGLYDMNGNVAEWVADWYGADYYAGSPHSDPRGPSAGSYRVFRGGAWLTEAKLCRPTIRNFDFPNSRFYHVGFRLVRVTV